MNILWANSQITESICIKSILVLELINTRVNTTIIMNEKNNPKESRNKLKLFTSQSSAKPNLHISAITLSGRSNEEGYAVKELDSKWQQLSQQQKEQTIEVTYDSLQQQLEKGKYPGGACVISATISPTVNQNEYFITTALTGDCEAYLLLVENSKTTLEQLYKNLHHPNVDSEKSRILAHIQRSKTIPSEYKKRFDPTKRKIKFDYIPPPIGFPSKYSVRVSRALGNILDPKFQQWGLTHKPDISHKNVQLQEGQIGFVLLFSDGLRDGFANNSALLNFIDENKQKLKTPELFIEQLAKYKFDKKEDDRTVVLAKLEGGKVKQLTVIDGHAGIHVKKFIEGNFISELEQQISANSKRMLKNKL